MDSLSILTEKFATEILFLVDQLQGKNHEFVISNQIYRSATSIGANYNEASVSFGRRDFIAKLRISLKEAKETRYWLILLNNKGYISESQFNKLVTECQSIINMLYSSVRTARKNAENNN